MSFILEIEKLSIILLFFRQIVSTGLIIEGILAVNFYICKNVLTSKQLTKKNLYVRKKLSIKI